MSEMKPTRYKFPRTCRLAGRRNFARVFAAKCSASNRLLVIYAAANDLPNPRLGLSVGRRLGTAVRRNRIKRLLREAFRLELRRLPGGYDFVCIPRGGEDATLDAFRSALVTVSQKAMTRYEAWARAQRSP